MSMSAQKCCVPGCIESGNSHRTLHLFPNPTKERERFNDWVFAINGDIISLSNEDIYRLRRVCHAHFEEKFCLRFNRINKTALPTLNLPGPLALPRFTFIERRPLRRVQDGLNLTPSTSTGPTVKQEQPKQTLGLNKDNEPEVSVQDGASPIPSTSTGPMVKQPKHTYASKKRNEPKVSMQDGASTVPSTSTGPTVKQEQPMQTLGLNKENEPEVSVQDGASPIPSTSTGPMVKQTKHTYASKKRNEPEVSMQDGASTVPSTSTGPIVKHTLESSKENEPEVPEVSKGVPASKREPKSPQKSKKGFTGKIVKKVTFTPAEQMLYGKLVKARIKLSKCRNKIQKQSASLKAAKNIASNPVLLKSLENFSTASKIFTLMQFREQKKKSKGRRFNIDEKILALSIFKQAPKAYRFLRKMFILPAPQTLAKLISQANVKPGINKLIFNQLKNVASKMKTEEKLCILLFDEMFLKANVSYNERKDKIVGFVTDGQNSKQEYADHAQVFMVRGLLKNYKQSIAYSFSAGATSGQQIAKQIKDLVTELQEAGLIVVATICDQGSNNQKAIKLLLQETRGVCLRSGQEPKKNIIVINGSEIVPLYDPPHLLKCVRNNLLTKNLEYNTNGVKKTAKWEHIEKLHAENPGYKGVRLIPKLSDSHVVASKISKMKVKFATQVFSRTVATNMGYLADKGILPKECIETADLLLFFDNLFDSQNGSYNKEKQKYAKPLLGAVTPKSNHHKEWEKAKKTLKEMKFVNRDTGKKENVPTLDNWAWTLEGTEVVLKKLELEYQVTSVWMRHLNQDPIENFFGAIRSHGCRNTNPTPEKFESAFTTLLINNMTSVHAPIGANCEEDFCKNLQAFMITKTPTDCSAATTYDYNYITNVHISDVNEKNDPRIKGALEYISGYFIKSVQKNVFKACICCKSNVIATEGKEYIKYREYAGRRWLCSPTDSVVQCVSAIQDIANAILKQNLNENNLKELIKTHLFMFLEFQFLDCPEHKDGIINYLLNLSTRFFIFNYSKDLNKILNGKRDVYDEDDKFQIKAKKYFKKCSKRPIKK